MKKVKQAMPLPNRSMVLINVNEPSVVPNLQLPSQLHHLMTGTKLYSFMTKAYGCELLV